ncbi:MAG TPA: DUF3110 domain-containing protein [Thermoleophilaceae bacterium]
MVRVNVKDVEPAEEMLREQIVPRVSQAPGFVTGYWTRSSDETNGLSVVVFESEDAAQAAARQLEEQGSPSEAVDLDSVEVREVVAHA